MNDAHANEAPYAGLGPDVVLDALDAVGLRGDGRLLQLNSYENRVFQVFLEDGTVVVAKFYRPARWTDAQILEEHDFSRELAAAEIPVVAPISLTPTPGGRLDARVSGQHATLAAVEASGHTYRFSVTPRRAGQAPDLDNLDTLEWLGRFIGRIHAIGAQQPFVTRRRVDAATLGDASIAWLEQHDTLPPAAAPAWHRTATEAVAMARQAFANAGNIKSLRLHGDCHPGNVLWTEAGPHFVDLDDAMNGPAVQDLWMLLSGDRLAMTQQLNAVLEGYETFFAFERAQLRLIEALRTLRMIHHSAWIAQRWGDPAFPLAFPFFEGAAYWAQQTTQLREQLEAMNE